MKIAIYGISFEPHFLEAAQRVFEKLSRQGCEVFVLHEFYAFMNKKYNFRPEVSGSFSVYEDLPCTPDFMISIGGDGTLLDTAHFVGEHEVPVIGINSGRLGFLANISSEDIDQALDEILKGKYKMDERSLIEIKKPAKLFGTFNAALNEITIQKKDSSMVTIKVFLNGDFVNTYWADGLIISTPTGSTAYSMSVGGPIVSPMSETFVISPIAPHNLTVRPLIVPDSYEILLKVSGRGNCFLLSMDSFATELPSSTEIVLRKSPTRLRLAKLEGQDFYSTLRNKLLWGLDKRN
jgi:NAD+ kinase